MPRHARRIAAMHGYSRLTMTQPPCCFRAGLPMPQLLFATPSMALRATDDVMSYTQLPPPLLSSRCHFLMLLRYVEYTCFAAQALSSLLFFFFHVCQ